jgi:hypothetical protein
LVTLWRNFGITPPLPGHRNWGVSVMHGIIYLVGLVVVVLFILSALGLR